MTAYLAAMYDVKTDDDVVLRYHVDQVKLVSVPCYKEIQPFIYNNIKSFGAMIPLYW